MYRVLYDTGEMILSKKKIVLDKTKGVVLNNNNIVQHPTEKMDIEEITAITSITFETLVQPTSCYSWFEDCRNLKEFHNLKYLDTSNCEDMSNMFNCCCSIVSLDLSYFDTSKVTNMYAMFEDCSKLETLNLKNFNTKNVEAMSMMFYNCQSLKSLNLSKFKTSSLKDICQMFGYCFSLETLDLTSFDVSKVIDNYGLCSDCKNLKTVKLPDTLFSLNKDMFLFTKNLKEIYWKNKKYNVEDIITYNEVY